MDESVTDVRLKIIEKNQDKMFACIDSIDTKIDTLKDNHLAHLRADIESLKVTLTENTTDTKWIKIFVPLIVGAAAAMTILLQRFGV